MLNLGVEPGATGWYAMASALNDNTSFPLFTLYYGSQLRKNKLY